VVARQIHVIAPQLYDVLHRLQHLFARRPEGIGNALAGDCIEPGSLFAAQSCNGANHMYNNSWDQKCPFDIQKRIINVKFIVLI
jgi:hypothetical protein